MTHAGFGTGPRGAHADQRVILLRDLQRGGSSACTTTTGAWAWEADREQVQHLVGLAVRLGHTGRQTGRRGRRLAAAGLRPKTREVVWTVTGLPSQPCTTPVVAGGRLLCAGWSYGGTPEMGEVPPLADYLKQAGQERLGYLTRAGAEKTDLKGYFDSSDPNGDGKITCEE